MRFTKAVSSFLSSAAIVMICASAAAQERRDGWRDEQRRGDGRFEGERRRSDPLNERARDREVARAYAGPMVLDRRYNHDHYYPIRGHMMQSLPHGTMAIGFNGMQLYFNSGVWMRQQRGGFMVISPPIGVYVPRLPAAYTSIAISGAPYFYANDVYYAAAHEYGFQVVAAPTELGAVQLPPAFPPPGQSYPTNPPLGIPEPIIYPRQGQSPQQRAIDLQECKIWAVNQPGSTSNADIFQRALGACMDGRGYSLR
jgi:hypothetical protein